MYFIRCQAELFFAVPYSPMGLPSNQLSLGPKAKRASTREKDTLQLALAQHEQKTRVLLLLL